MKYAILLSFVAALSSCTTQISEQQARPYSRQRKQVSEEMQAGASSDRTFISSLGHTSIARPEARQPARRPSVNQPPPAPPMPDTQPQTSQRSRVISPAKATRPPQKTSKH